MSFMQWTRATIYEIFTMAFSMRWDFFMDDRILNGLKGIPCQNNHQNNNHQMDGFPTKDYHFCRSLVPEFWLKPNSVSGVTIKPKPRTPCPRLIIWSMVNLNYKGLKPAGFQSHVPCPAAAQVLHDDTTQRLERGACGTAGHDWSIARSPTHDRKSWGLDGRYHDWDLRLFRFYIWIGIIMIIANHC